MAILTVSATGGATYTTVAAAVSASNDLDTIEIQDNSSYDEAFPSNVNHGNLIFSSDRTDPDDMPTLTLTGGNYENWWNNVEGTRTFSKLNMGSFIVNPITSGSNRLVFAEKCVFDGNASDIFQLGDSSTPLRVVTDSCLFINCTGTIYKQNATTNNDVTPVLARNCAFYGNTLITDNTINMGQLRYVHVINSAFNSNTVVCDDADVLAKWNYCYAEDVTGWGVGSISGANPFVNSGGTNPSDYKLNPTSGAVAQGTDTNVPAQDIGDGFWNTLIDIGAWKIDSVLLPPPVYKTRQYHPSINLSTNEMVEANQYVGRDIVTQNGIPNCQNGVVLTQTKRS